MIRAAVAGLVQALEIGGVDSGHITERMREFGAQQIMPAQARDHIDPREAVPVDGEGRDLGLAQIRAQDGVFKAALFAERRLEALHMARLNGYDPAEFAQQSVEIFDLLGHDLQPEGGPVFGQHPPATVINQAAGRRDGQDLDPVCLGQGAKVFMPDDGQIKDLGQHDAEQQQHHRAAHDDAPRHQARLIILVLEDSLHGRAPLRPGADEFAAQVAQDDKQPGPEQHAGESRHPVAPAASRQAQREIAKQHDRLIQQ